MFKMRDFMPDTYDLLSLNALNYVTKQKKFFIYFMKYVILMYLI